MSYIVAVIAQRPEVDFVIPDEGSIILLRPETDAAQTWIDDHILEDATTWGDAIVVEPRYIALV
jgi:hypothetical protein